MRLTWLRRSPTPAAGGDELRARGRPHLVARLQRRSPSRNATAGPSSGLRPMMLSTFCNEPVQVKCGCARGATGVRRARQGAARRSRRRSRALAKIGAPEPREG
jgi:hypothetical protein